MKRIKGYMARILIACVILLIFSVIVIADDVTSTEGKIKMATGGSGENDTYFIHTLNNIPAGNSFGLENTTYNGWCVDEAQQIDTNKWYDTTIYTPSESNWYENISNVPERWKNIQWNKIVHIVNNRAGYKKDYVQDAIWHYSNGKSVSGKVLELVNDADANAQGCDSYLIKIRIIFVKTDKQLTILQYEPPSSTPSPTVSSTPSPTVSSTPSPTVSSTPSPTVSSTPSPTVSPTPSSTASPTPSSTATSTPSSTASPTPSSTATSTSSPTASPTPSSTATSTPSPTASPTPSSTASPSPSSTATSTPKPTKKPTPKPTNTPSVTQTPDPTNTPGVTTTPISTNTPSVTPTPDEIIEIFEEEVPGGPPVLPQTAGLPEEAFYLIGGLIALNGTLLTKKKENKN